MTFIKKKSLSGNPSETLLNPNPHATNIDGGKFGENDRRNGDDAEKWGVAETNSNMESMDVESIRSSTLNEFECLSAYPAIPADAKNSFV